MRGSICGLAVEELRAMKALLRHIRGTSKGNVAAYVALFLALTTGTASAIFLLPNSVKSKHIAWHAIKAEDIAQGAVLGGKIATGKFGVHSINIADGEVHSVDIADGEVKGRDLAAGVIYAYGSPVAEGSVVNPNDEKTVDAVCPAGKDPITGGATIYGAEWFDPPPAGGVVALTENRPVWPPETLPGEYLGWRASAIEVNGGTTEDWMVVAYVICGKGAMD
jgi:hypothetical protein